MVDNKKKIIKPRKKMFQGHKTVPVLFLKKIFVPICLSFVTTVFLLSFILNTDSPIKELIPNRDILKSNIFIYIIYEFLYFKVFNN